MMTRQIPLTLVGAALLLAGCASRGTGAVAGDEAAPDAGGIQTSGIRSAAAATRASNDSRPLSELNTPDAIAAREAEARNAPRGAAAPAAAISQAAAAPEAAGLGATAETEALMATSDPHRQNASLLKGGTVRIRSGATLRSRPSQSSERVESAALGAEWLLGAQVYNADGYWWYVSAGKETGWLLQTDVAR